MIHFPALPTSFSLLRTIMETRHTFASKVGKITTKISIQEINFYLKQAIDLCYQTGGKKLPLELKKWQKRGVKINYSELPPEIQDVIQGVLFKSPLAKGIIRDLIINLPF